MYFFDEDTDEVQEEKEVEEVSSDVVTLEAYKCLECFDVFTEDELKGNVDKCPSCGEDAIIEA